MALMKRYHDEGDNEEHIKAYLESKKNVIDVAVLERIKKYIAKEPCCMCRFRINVSRNDFCIFIAGLVFLVFIGGMLYFMATSYITTSSPPPSTHPV